MEHHRPAAPKRRRPASLRSAQAKALPGCARVEHARSCVNPKKRPASLQAITLPRDAAAALERWTVPTAYARVIVPRITVQWIGKRGRERRFGSRNITTH